MGVKCDQKGAEPRLPIQTFWGLFVKKSGTRFANHFFITYEQKSTNSILIDVVSLKVC